jgi:hypothetical protein
MLLINLIEAAGIINLIKAGEIFSPFVLEIDLLMYKSLLDVIKTVLEIIVIIIAGVWAIFKILEFREFKHWIQFEIDANIYPLRDNITTDSHFWDENYNALEKQETFTHALEILFKFKNKGKTRIKIYNIQARISTLPPSNDISLSKSDGHLHLSHIFTGNIVPQWKKFYYIEPQVEQTITYLTLIKKPKDIIKIHGKFCQDHERIYPKKESKRRHFKFNYLNSLCDFLEREKEPVFDWCEIPGDDSEKLREYLKQRFHADWVEKARIEKINNKIIKLFNDGNCLSLHLRDQEPEVILRINDNVEKFLITRDADQIKFYRRNSILKRIFGFIYKNRCLRLLSHTAERTYSLDGDGFIRK